MKLEQAKVIAEKYLNLLKPYCLKAKIAGSIRREKSNVKDIEIVIVVDILCIVDFYRQVNKWQKIKGEPIGKYTQRLLPEGIKLDLFIANLDNWGNIFLIRTGDWQFSKWIMGTKTKEVGLQQKDGYLCRGNEKLNCPEEEDIFKLLKMNFIEPKLRN